MTDSEMLTEMRADIKDLLQAVARLEMKSHTPASCALASDVKRLSLTEARLGGKMAIVGALVLVMVNGLFLVGTKLWGR